MLCRVCSSWAREFIGIENHHPACPLHAGNLHFLVEKLVSGIKRWAAEEDGIPDFLQAAMDETRIVLEGEQ